MNQMNNLADVNSQYPQVNTLNLLPMSLPWLHFPHFTQFNPHQAMLAYNLINSHSISLLASNYPFDSKMMPYHSLWGNPQVNSLEERAKTSESTIFSNCNLSISQSNKEANVANAAPEAIVANSAEHSFQSSDKAIKAPPKPSAFKTVFNALKPPYKQVFRTRQLKSSIKKRENKKIYQCGHKVCGLVCKTKKQIISHHGKMNHDCQKDTTYLLKMVFKTKQLLKELLAEGKAERKRELARKYEETMNEVSIKEYAHLICGLTFDDVFSKDR